MISVAELETYATKVYERYLLVTHACYRLGDKRRELGLTDEEEKAAAALGAARTHLDAEQKALAHVRGLCKEPVPTGTLAIVLTALGDDQYNGVTTLTPEQQVIGRLSRFERIGSYCDEGAKNLFGEEVPRG